MLLTALPVIIAALIFIIQVALYLGFFEAVDRLSTYLAPHILKALRKARARNTK